MSGHTIEFDKDEGGWDIGTCSCGWTVGPVPGADIVADEFADHCVAEALAARGDTP